MPAKIYCATLQALDAQVVEVEVDVAPGLPGVNIVGLADASIKESKERVRGCLRNSQYFKYPAARITINLAPADILKYGTQFDLAIALGILLASRQLYFPTEDKIFLGELSLDGAIRPVQGVLPLVLAAKEKGIRQICLPEENAVEASMVEGVEIVPLTCLEDFVNYIHGTPLVNYQHTKFNYIKEFSVDLTDIYGQDFAKRGLEIAAAGGHNLSLCGPPGAGKTLLAHALPGLLPEPTPEEQMEIIKLYSIAGLIKNNSVVLRPFRSPHHSITMQAFIGGGTIPRPGEISLAHRGILFLDELPEFPRRLIEALRQPLENGSIKVSRMLSGYNFPAQFILVTAQNPCLCGYYQEERNLCRCSINQLLNYQRRVSGPILDRVDLQIRVNRVNMENLTIAATEDSATVLEKVRAAWQVQYARYGMVKLNGHASAAEVKKFCVLDDECRNILALAENKYAFSARTYFRLIKISRTIADLDHSAEIKGKHLAESIQYRFRDEGEYLKRFA